MQLSRIAINSRLYNQLVEFLKREIQTTYVYETTDTLLIAGEQYRFRINSYQMYMIIIKKTAVELQVDLVCGGGGDGIFNFSLGAEGAFIRKTKKLLKKFCESHQSSLKELP